MPMSEERLAEILRWGGAITMWARKEGTREAGRMLVEAAKEIERLCAEVERLTGEIDMTYEEAQGGVIEDVT